MILDAHQHFWRKDRGDYHWMSPAVGVLYQDYLPEHLQPCLRKAGVAKTIVVQAAQTTQETDFLLGLAVKAPSIVGVVGWLDMTRSDFPAQLARYSANAKFVGVRPMLQDITADDWILQPQVLANLRHLADVDFPFEFLTYARHLPHVVAALRATPGLRAVVDHISKPEIKAKKLEPWKSLLKQVADFPNVFCKLSGMITEADHQAWTPDDLRPYVEHAFKCFGVDRVMFGSDWPVCLLAGSYADVINALRTVLPLDAQANSKLFHDNAARFYKLH